MILSLPRLDVVNDNYEMTRDDYEMTRDDYEMITRIYSRLQFSARLVFAAEVNDKGNGHNPNAARARFTCSRCC
jgi:hypothetical protein